MSKPLRVAILGAGLPGIAVAARLSALGFDDLVVLDAAARPCGLWARRRHPGAVHDISAHLHSLPDAPFGGWTRTLPSYPEGHAYLLEALGRTGVERHVRVGVTVERVTFDADHGPWIVTLAEGEPIRADVVVHTLHPEPRPTEPAGVDDFAGRVLSLGEWDAQFDLKGATLLVVGHGRDVVQAVPELVAWAGHTIVIDPHRGWVLPRGDRPYARWRQWTYRHVPPVRTLHAAKAVVRHDRLGAALSARATRAHARLRRTAAEHLESQVDDPWLRTRLAPHGPLGPDTVAFSDDWYATLTRHDVDYVPDPVERVTVDGIRTADGAVHRGDVLVVGDDTAPDERNGPPVHGPDGRVLDASHAPGRRGMAVAGFPNLFFIDPALPAWATDESPTVVFDAARHIGSAVTGLAERDGATTIEIAPDAAAVGGPDAELAIEHRRRIRYRADDYRFG